MAKNTFMSSTPAATGCQPSTSTTKSGPPASPQTPDPATRVGTERGRATTGSINSTSASGSASPVGAGAAPAFKAATNAYGHNTNNITGGGQASDPGKMTLPAQFLANILDSYDVVTYHWKLFIVDPETSSSGAVFDTSKQIIIAESGITDLTIDNVRVETLTTPSVESGTGVMTDVKFEIVEPGGAGLIDKLFYQSIALGIGNWATMPVYLQLQFKNRSPETSEVDDGHDAGSLANLKWMWPLKITGIKTSVSQIGARYDFETKPYNEYVQSNANFSLQHNVVLTDIETFSDAMSKLQKKLNEDQISKLMDNYSVPDTFNIVVDPDIAGYKITPNDKNTNPRRNDNFIKFVNKDATFQSGTSVDKIIDSLLSQTDEYQKSMKWSPTPNKNGVPMEQEPSQLKDFWRIVTETRPVRYDPRRDTLANDYTIYVVKYSVGILEQNQTQNSNPPATLAAEKKRFQEYLDKMILRKKYNYIFTGLNDQIIDFDLKINCAYAVAQSRYAGIYSNLSLTDKGVVTHNHAEEEKAESKSAAAAVSLQNNASGTDASRAEASSASKNAISASELSPDTSARIKTLLDKSKSNDMLSYLREVQKAGGINNDGSLNSSRVAATNLAKPVTETMSQKQFRFISDVNITSAEAKSAYSEYTKYAKGKLRPIARIESMQDRQVGLGVEANSNSGIQKLSSMFSVALHSGLDNSFTNIKLTIKGDPFWLSPQPVTDNNSNIFMSRRPGGAIEWIKRAHFNTTDYVNVLGTDNFLLIRFRSPRIYNDNENPDIAPPNTEVETLSGVYKVTRIAHKFEGGKFSQELECIIDPEIRVLNISDQIEEASKQLDVPTTPDTINRSRDIPLESIKTQKIMGQLGKEFEGVQDQVRTAIGDIKTLGSEAVGKGIQTAKANIPSAIKNALPGLPDIFG